jgi:UDP-glucuronate decarboxylase
MLRLMESPADFIGPVNIGNPDEFTIMKLAETALRLVGGQSKLIFLPLPQDDPKQRKPDISLARSKLQWEPKVSLEDGLKETIAYFRKLLNV